MLKCQSKSTRGASISRKSPHGSIRLDTFLLPKFIQAETLRIHVHVRLLSMCFKNANIIWFWMALLREQVDSSEIIYSQKNVFRFYLFIYLNVLKMVAKLMNLKCLFFAAYPPPAPWKKKMKTSICIKKNVQHGLVEVIRLKMTFWMPVWWFCRRRWEVLVMGAHQEGAGPSPPQSQEEENHLQLHYWWATLSKCTSEARTPWPTFSLVFIFTSQMKR